MKELTDAELERLFLGCVLRFNDFKGVLAAGLRGRHFASRANRHYFSAMVKLFRSRVVIDPVTLADCLTDSGVVFDYREIVEAWGNSEWCQPAEILADEIVNRSNHRGVF